MSGALTNDGSEVIIRNLQLSPCEVTPIQDIDTVFCIDHVVNWIKSKGFKQIGLQFPDELLSSSTLVCEKLCERSGEFCFIMGDSSFAGCCVDEVAGQRFYIDALVHFGRACLSELFGRLPVLYIFGQLWTPGMHSGNQLSVATQSLHQKLKNLSASCTPTIVITYDFRFQTLAHAFYEKLTGEVGNTANFIWSEPSVVSPAETVTQSSFDHALQSLIFRRCGRNFHPTTSFSPAEPSSWILIHIGLESDKLAAYRILLSFPEVPRTHSFLLTADNFILQPLDIAIHSFMKRRSFLVEKAKDAQNIGILIGTLSVRGYKTIVSRIQCLLSRFGRFHITLVVGKINPAKLANLPELDLLVLVACPEASLLDSRDMLIPVVTPFELECALSSLVKSSNNTETEEINALRAWTTEQMPTDYNELLPGGSMHVPVEQLAPSCSLAKEFADVSLITGKIRVCRTSEKGDDSLEPVNNMALANRSDWSLVETQSSSSSFQRTWFGLDPQLGQTPVALVKEGLHGLPVQYTTTETSDPVINQSR